MIEQSIAQRGSTRHHRTDPAFADLLAEDFGLSPFAAHALVGAPKRASIAVCQWATDNITDPDDRGKAVRAWARKRGVGVFDERLIDHEPPTYGGHEPEGV